MDILTALISIITSGVLGTILTLKFSKISSKADAYRRLEDFWQQSNENIRQEFQKKINDLEQRILALEPQQCQRPKCRNRVRMINA